MTVESGKNKLNKLSQKNLRHFIDIDSLPKELLKDILDLAESFAVVSGQPVKKVPLLRGKTIVNLFFESLPGHEQLLKLLRKDFQQMF